MRTARIACLALVLGFVACGNSSSDVASPKDAGGGGSSSVDGGGSGGGGGGSGWPGADGGPSPEGGGPCSNEGATEACYSGAPATQGIGACHDGTRTCTGGTWSACAGEVTPSVESCDTKDNNCDGVADEGCSCVDGTTQPCTMGGSSGVGICKSGTQTCASGSWSSTCEGAVGPEKESCNGKDDDCNGKVDDGDPGGGGSCSTGLPGPCASGTQHCNSGKLTCESNTPTSDPACKPCVGCLGFFADCNQACQHLIGSPGGSCGAPTSTDPTACCSCSATLNCAGCLGGSPDCNAACKNIGKSGGYCAYDNSTNPSQCCGCW